MSMIRWSAALVASGLLVGCANKSHKNEPAPPPPLAPSAPLSLDQARSQLRAANPLSMVGVVTAVHANQDLLAVRDMQSENLSVNDPVSIVTNDSAMRQIVLGQVKKVEPNLVIVQFDSRQGVPTPGQFAVRAPLPPGAPMRDGTGTGIGAGTAPDAVQTPAPSSNGNPPSTDAGTEHVTTPSVPKNPAPSDTPAPTTPATPDAGVPATPPTPPATPDASAPKTPTPPPANGTDAGTSGTAAPTSPASGAASSAPAPEPKEVPAPPENPNQGKAGSAPSDAGSAPATTQTPAPPAPGAGSDANKPDLNK